MKHLPEFIFETSWEVCNKVGGIHTVITSKIPEFYEQFGENMIFVGPDFVKDTADHQEFTEDKSLHSDWKKEFEKTGLRIRIGRWKTVHNPIAILIDFTPLIPQKDEIFAKLWENYQVDSLNSSWDYVEATLFGYAVGMLAESFSDFNLEGKKVLAQFHEWMTGSGTLYLKDNAPHIATTFTTHATVLGRSVAGNGLPLYSSIGHFDADAKAKELGVSAKHSIEKAAAHNAGSFTTVSEVTANECTHLLSKVPDIITPNGFALAHLKPITEKTVKDARKKLFEVTKAMTGLECTENTVFLATSGRYEYKNKGIDIFLESLAKLNQNTNLQQNVIGFILVPAQQYGPRKDLFDLLNSGKGEIDQQLISTHNMNCNAYDPVLDKCQQLQLLNYQGQMAKVIFAPVYLNGNDGIFNIDYYDLLSGFDLSAFPSYYEPWGYTPLESIAVGVPTVTTSLSGFGQWMDKYSQNITQGLAVIERNEENYWQVAEELEKVILTISQTEQKERKQIRKASIELAKNTVWENFKLHYFQAYEKAVEQSQPQGILIKKKNRTNNMETKQLSNEPNWRKMIIHSNLPEKLKVLDELSMNLWWCWNYEAIELFESIDPKLWVKCDKNPIALLNTVPADRLAELEKDKKFINLLNKVYTTFTTYMGEAKTDNLPTIGYFSMEYGLSDNLKIFSGGLGILAGDYIKEASDCNTPLVAMGFLYKFGYFAQQLTSSGEQQANMVAQKFSNLPIVPVYDEIKQPLTITVNLPGRPVKAKIWKVQVGRIPLYLLDTDVEDNNHDDRVISHQLYGGDWENRLKQEIFLGLGGIRALKSLNIKPDIFHCNEGHAALINVERLSNLVQNDNLTFEEALEVVRSTSLFTTHTPVPAGHDAFDEELIRTYMRHMPERLKIDWDRFLNLGRGHENAHGEKFSMSVLAARTSQEMNGVSRLHGDVSKDMFQYLWKGFAADELHIDYVTNGVHYPTWTDTAWQRLYEKEFDKKFLSDQSNKAIWNKIFEVDDKKIWEVRNQLRANLIEYIKERFEAAFIRRHEKPKYIVDIIESVNNKTLTIGFARRFATYKRAHLIFSDIERLARIVNNPDKPVQFLFAGKAHPHDGAGQGLIKHIVEISKRPEFLGKILFVENYDMELGKQLTSGVDVWLNNPTRPLEASGTSGQKAEMNGVLNFSVLDGWWVEGYKEKAGWALSEKRTYENQEYQNELDAATIYSILENEIVPLFYDRDENDVPKEWVQYIKRSIAYIAPEFTTKRMLDDYISKFYRKLGKRSTLIHENQYEKATELSNWKKAISENWEKIEVVSVDFPNTQKNNFKMGENYHGEVVLDLKDMDDSNLGVELVFALPGSNKIIDTKEITLSKKVNTLSFYLIDFELEKPGAYEYGIRIYPKHELLPHRQDFPILRWV